LESVYNPDFNYGEIIIKSHAWLNFYNLSVKEGVERKNAIGLYNIMSPLRGRVGIGLFYFLLLCRHWVAGWYLD
jgi:hypothetical protein